MKVLRSFLALGATLSLVLIGTGTVSAAASTGITCSGSFTSPGHIAPGTYASIKVLGFCFIPGGNVVDKGDMTLAKGATLLANFPAGTPLGPEGDANVLVNGSVFVGERAMLLLGCSPGVGCANTTHDTIKGNLVASDALGVVLHSDVIGGSVHLNGGGGGVTCTPSGIFALIGSPDYSNSSSDVIHGDLTVINLRSCWFGVFADIVMGNVYVAHNIFADPDATEVGNNEVFGSLACFNNVPKAQFGDSTQPPNVVLGAIRGECKPLSIH
jgi:hypothetical protein